MKKKIRVIVLSIIFMVFFVVASFLLWPRVQDVTFLGAENISIHDETIELNVFCVSSAPKYVSHHVSYDQGIYTITLRTNVFYGEHWNPEGKHLKIKINGEVKAISLKDHEKTKVIYPV